jgi:hypothetical protein
MRCPICLCVTQNVSPALGDYSTFECRSCGIFEVTGTGLTELIDKSLAERGEALERAKREAGPDKVPRISAMLVLS